MMLGTIRALAIGALLLVGALGADLRPAAAADTEWKMHIVWVPARDEAQTYQKFVDSVNERTGDKLKIQLFNGGSLGVKDVDMLRLLPPGNVFQIAGFYPGYVTRDVPEFANLLPSGLIDDPNKIVELLPMLRELYQGVYDKWGIKLLAFLIPQNRTFHVFCAEPINTLEGLKGKKIRVHEQHSVEMFKKLGIAAQVIPQNDMYVALQQGVVDCAYYPAGYAKTQSLQEVVKHGAYLTPYAIHPLSIIVSKKAFDELPPDVQQIVQEEATKMEKEQIARFQTGEWDDAQIKELVAAGGIMMEPFSEADRKAFAEASRQAWVELNKAAGESSTAYMTKIGSALNLKTE